MLKAAGALMVWGDFSAKWRVVLDLVVSFENAEAYVDVLSLRLLTFI